MFKNRVQKGMAVHKTLGVPKWALVFKDVSPGTKGGQNANRNYTAVELRFDTRCLANIEPATLERLLIIAKSRISKDGILVLRNNTSRSREVNFQQVVNRLACFLKEAGTKPKKRISTRPTKASKLRQREVKIRHSRKKAERRDNKYH